MERNKRILLIGGEDVSARIPILGKFNQFGIDVEIAGSQKRDLFDEEGINYYKFPLAREFNPFMDMLTLLRLFRIIKRGRYDLVHCFDTKLSILVPIAACILKVKVYRTINGLGVIFTEDEFIYRILRNIYITMQRTVKGCVDFNIFQNQNDYDYFIRLKLAKKEKSMIILSSGIDLELFKSTGELNLIKLRKEINPHSRVTFVLVSRLIKQKGISDYLEAARRCFQLGYSFNFILVGQIDDTRNAVDINTIMDFSEYVYYLGKRSDISEILSLSDVFVLPTYYREGVPRVLLEAGSIGKAIITTTVPGCVDFIKEDWNGKLVNPKNPEMLAKTMIELGTDIDLREKFSENNLENIKKFSLDFVAQQHLKAYNKL